MKLRPLLLSLAAACVLLSAHPALAQGTAPPAFGVGQRLAAEAQAAAAVHDDRTSHDRAVQAQREFQQVVASHEYGSGPWGAEALYQTAQVQETLLHQDFPAIQSLQQLQNNYRSTDYPSKGQVSSFLASLEHKVDIHNRTTPPGSNLYAVINFFVTLFGGSKFSYSYALAILAISIIVRLALTPLSNKQFASMREMQKLQPQIKEVQNKYKNDKEMAGRKVMELYKERGINPAAGCLPMLVQLPILYLLYYMIRLYQFQFNNGHFLWIGSPLSHLYPQFFAPNLGLQDIPLLLLYALSMYVTQKLTITPSLDPQQAEQQRTMAIMTPFLSTYLFLQWHLPSAFVLYYLIFNILSTAQQKWYMQRRHADIHGEPEVDKDNDPNVPKMLSDGSVPRNGSNGILPGGGKTNGITSNGARTNGAKSNGAVPSAKGVIAPPKIHPKKKRR